MQNEYEMYSRLVPGNKTCNERNTVMVAYGVVVGFTLFNCTPVDWASDSMMAPT